MLWAQAVNDVIVNLPLISSFSTSTPNNSNLSGDRGEIGINLSSDGSRVWVNYSGTTSDWSAIL